MIMLFCENDNTRATNNGLTGRGAGTGFGSVFNGHKLDAVTIRTDAVGRGRHNGFYDGITAARINGIGNGGEQSTNGYVDGGGSGMPH